MTISLTQGKPCEIGEQSHCNCVVCGASNERGLRLKFTRTDDGGVQARFDCDRDFQGYADVLHGGVIAALLDGAMTNCMFAHGCPSVTAELNVRFRHPVMAEKDATVCAWIDRSSPPLHVLKARIIQDDQVKATASGTFMEKPHSTTRNEST